MFGSGLSNQTGAAIGSLAFPVLGPVGVVAARQYVAAIVLLTVGRPHLRSFTWRQWWPVLLLALVFGTMNLSLYSAIDRIGLGLAVTLEFLGPLSIALVASRRRADACCAVIAAAGVVTLMRPQPSADYVGMGLGLLAAVCWASYILLNRTVGRRVAGVGDRRPRQASPPWCSCRSDSSSSCNIRRPRGPPPALSPPASCPQPCRISQTCSPCGTSLRRPSVCS